MPELPEVELVARSLRAVLAARTITRATVLRPRLLLAPAVARAQTLLAGARFATCERRGKVLLLRFDAPWVLLAHLRMAGRFVLAPPGSRANPPHTHAEFALDDGARLLFCDARHFAVMKLVARERLDREPMLTELGPDALDPALDATALRERLAGTRRGIKDALLDQKRVAGLGNIYAAEALYEARVSPFAPASSLGPARLARLLDATRAVLRESLAHGSTLAVDPRAIDDSYYTGGFHGRWRVYDRAGERCPRCDATIARREQAGRSTYYCPRCQAR